SGLLHRHTTKAQTSHTIDVLCQVNLLKASTLIDMRRYWVLQQNTMHVWIAIKLVYFRHQLCSRRRTWHFNAYRIHTDTLTSITLHTYISRRSRIVTDQYRRE